ncbi:MAG: polyphosphate kinase 1 [Lachnospiraceae bacterium]|nr:polyphosphate kinase 1 [Ruminococcus sp.]MCM1274975.1 polyphosphate kinase 1 [Lachnospiraceae bacterium]
MSSGFYDNRELSWLKFNARVLEEARDEATPLFERLRFVQIFCSNLDEFFMIRVGSLHDKLLYEPKDRENKTNMNAKEQLSAIAKRVKSLLPAKDEAYSEIMQGLSEYGVEHLNEDALTPEEDAFLKAFFTREVRPLLFTGVVDKKHPVPFLKSGEIYIGCKIRKKTDASGKSTFGILPASENLPRVVFLPGTGKFILVEELIRRYAKQVFSNFDIISRCIFRVTRNADIEIDEGLFDHDVDFRDVMSKLVKKRKKLQPVRVEFQGSPDGEIVSVITKMLDISENYVFKQTAPLSMSFISVLEQRLEKQPSLFFTPLTPQKSSAILPNVPMIEQIKQHDILLNYPYENINQFINLLEEAAVNPNVSSIKITLYRVARDSKIINALNKAAENGKDVLALVELRARFDEENNIGWSKQLEEAGVTVIYGLEGLKVHSKLLLITLRDGNDVRYITQVGTGNYNERTSRLYTDFTLMTSDEDIGADASVVFNALIVGSTVESTNRLLVAPKGLKSRIVAYIDNEITYGRDGYIGIKINSLTDRDLIEKLAEASRAGVTVELIVRGICCLIPRIEGATENIRVISIVGRFLEHSRIYIFGRGDRRRVYISSADFMTRNTEKRVEVAAPILDTALADRVCDIFSTMLADNVKARELGADGKYTRVSAEGKPPLNSQMYFYDEAYKAAAAAEGVIGSEKPAANPVPKPNDNAPVKVKIRKVR